MPAEHTLPSCKKIPCKSLITAKNLGVENKAKISAVEKQAEAAQASAKDALDCAAKNKLEHTKVRAQVEEQIKSLKRWSVVGPLIAWWVMSAGESGLKALPKLLALLGL